MIRLLFECVNKVGCLSVVDAVSNWFLNKLYMLKTHVLPLQCHFPKTVCILTI